MPVICIFFGIAISMFYNDHEPPHFHAEYQGQRGKFDFEGKLIAGNIRSRTACRLIREWAQLRHTELEANWQNARLGDFLQRIEPLD